MVKERHKERGSRPSPPNAKSPSVAEGAFAGLHPLPIDAPPLCVPGLAPYRVPIEVLLLRSARRKAGITVRSNSIQGASTIPTYGDILGEGSGRLPPQNSPRVSAGFWFMHCAIGKGGLGLLDSSSAFRPCHISSQGFVKRYPLGLCKPVALTSGRYSWFQALGIRPIKAFSFRRAPSATRATGGG